MDKSSFNKVNTPYIHSTRYEVHFGDDSDNDSDGMCGMIDGRDGVVV